MKLPIPLQATATCVYLLFLACMRAGAMPLEFQSSQHQTTLLELYTSEGCSSCPPAEAWLSKLKNSPRLWAEFVPVAFHVDYWNNLGWKDKFSDEQYTERQRSYARLWSADNIYTPEFVLNGKEWHDWFGFRGAPSFGASEPGILQVQSNDGKHWTATFSPGQSDSSHYEVTAAVLVSNVASDVSAGENEGRHLNHDFAAISLITRALVLQTNGFVAEFIIDPDAKGITGQVALAVWVTHEGQPGPVQATGGWLAKSQQKQ
jgi:hypothetical protein